jgi:Mycothiol maleylpyruvate isomerase N-terminal domain
VYTSALEFLEEERDAWAAYEPLAELSDEAMEAPADPTGPLHGWRGRDLIAHLVGWQEHGVQVARELAVGTTSPTHERIEAEWDEREDEINEEIRARWAELPLEEVRRRLRETPGELRGYLTVVPETRWLKDPKMLNAFLEITVEHYAEHAAELETLTGSR